MDSEYLKERNIIALGAGVQSTTMALMAAHGEITPMPDCAIFADTGAEPAAVYDHLGWLRSANVLPFPVEIVAAGNIRDDTYAALRGEKHGKGRAATAPFFAPGKDGKGAPLRRQCTSHYKIEPMNRRIRELFGAKKGQRLPKGSNAIVWMGISTDESYRMKPSDQWWIERRWPLIEARMSRWDCLQWMMRNGYPQPPRSACTFCPYHSDNEWRRLRDEQPDDWADAIKVDAAIRQGFKTIQGTNATKQLYVHRSLVPLPDVDLSTPEDRGQLSIFGNECEGVCGV